MAAHSYWPCLTFFLYLPTSTLLLKLLLPETPLHPLPGERVLLTGRPLWEPPLTSQDTPPSLHCPRHEGRTPWPWGWPGDWQCQGCGRQVVTMACRSLTAPPQWAPDALGEGRVPPSPVGTRRLGGRPGPHQAHLVHQVPAAKLSPAQFPQTLTLLASEGCPHCGAFAQTVR